MRPTREQVLLKVAHIFAERSTCNRGKVGAILVQDNRIIATGYNGAPPGMPHCGDVGCDELMLYEHADELNDAGDEVYEEVNLGCQRTVHAEANALLYAARHGIATDGSVMYCTHSPCERCLMMMASAGIAEFIFTEKYRATPWDLAEQLGISWTYKEGYTA